MRIEKSGKLLEPFEREREIIEWLLISKNRF